jgi:Holliday junction DNA helicase RuvA
MIEGEVIYKNDDELIVKTSCGIAFELFYGQETSLHHKVSLFTYSVVRETGISLYAFATLAERNLFRNLLKIKGIGPKLAFNLINQLGVDAFLEAVINREESVLISVSGIGKKAAARIILELDTKSFNSSPLFTETLAATKALGLNDATVISLYQKILKENNPDNSSDMVRLILQGLE